MTTVKDRELAALLSLLETERPEAVGVLRQQIREFPAARIRALDEMASPASPVKAQIDLILAEHEAPRMQGALLEWMRGAADLEEGMFLVARTGYPLLDPGMVSDELDRIARDIRNYMPAMDPLKTLKGLAHHLRTRYGFHGDPADYNNPDNSYLNRVLERRAGLPLTLSVVYMLLGRRLGLDIVGVSLPGHFIAGLVIGDRTFYFDPFRDGMMLEMNDVMNIVNSAGFIFHPDTLRPATALQIVRRTLNNLENAYSLADDAERLSLVRQYLAVLVGST